MNVYVRWRYCRPDRGRGICAPGPVAGCPILKLGRVFDEVRTSIRSISDGTTPLMDEVTATVTTTNQQLRKVDGIASNVSDASANISALSSLVAATVGSPLIKVAAFSYGVRSAFAARKAPATGRRSR